MTERLAAVCIDPERLIYRVAGSRALRVYDIDRWGDYVPIQANFYENDPCLFTVNHPPFNPRIYCDVEMAETRRMKLYVWADPYDVTYGSSLGIAVAETLEEARRQLLTAKGYYYCYSVVLTEADMTDVVLGEPTRVLDLPCAEWYQWEE